MISAEAPAKINLALVVGGLRPDGLHEIATILQRIDLSDTVSLEPAAELSVEGFPDDTIVRRALEAVAAASGVEPNWRAKIEKRIPVAAGLGGGSSDAATAIMLACALLEAPPPSAELAALAAKLGADVPFFLEAGPQLGTGTGTTLEPLELPQDYWVLLAMPHGDSKRSTAEIYARFDRELGFEARRTLLLEVARAGRAADLGALPPNDLASSPLAARLRSLGAFRADVSGAGPVVYGLFADRPWRNAPWPPSSPSAPPGWLLLRGSVFPDGIGRRARTRQPGLEARQVSPPAQAPADAVDRGDRRDTHAARRDPAPGRLRARDRGARLVDHDGTQVHVVDRAPLMWIFAMSQAIAVLIPAALHIVKGLAIAAIIIAVIAGLVLLFAERDKL